MIIWAKILSLFTGFTKKHAVGVAVAIVLIFTHFGMYISGIHHAEKGYLKQQIADLDKAVKESQARAEVEKDLLNKSNEALSKIKEFKSQIPKQVDHYVETNPKDPSCNLTPSDVEFLRSIIQSR